MLCVQPLAKKLSDMLLPTEGYLRSGIKVCFVPKVGVIVITIRAGDLKQAVMNAYYDRIINAQDVQSVFAEYGLKHD